MSSFEFIAAIADSMVGLRGEGRRGVCVGEGDKVWLRACLFLFLFVIQEKMAANV
jgi:hypothetical protein